MLGTGKNMGILLLSITVVLSAATFLTTQNLDKSSSSDVALLMGHMTLKVFDENGYVKVYRQTDNVIVDGGWNTLVENAFSGDYTFDPDGNGPGTLSGTSVSPFSHIGIGSDDGTTLTLGSTNFELGAEITACDRSPIGIFSDGASSASGSSITVKLFAEFDAEFDVGCRGTDIKEAGLFNGTSGGTMFARNTFDTVPALGPFDFLEIAWDFTFTSTPLVGP